MTIFQLKYIVFILIIATTMSTMAKSNERLLKYKQITDKEVLLESNKGTKILFTAFDNHSIGIIQFSKQEEVLLISPDEIIEKTELEGSIYIEEIDELMQITTTSPNGLMIKVDRNKFGFTFIDKSNNSEIVFEEEQLAGTVNSDQPICIVVEQSVASHRMEVSEL